MRPFRGCLRCCAWLRLAAAAWVLSLLAACGSQVALYSTISEGEANELLSVLLDSGVKAEKTVDKNGSTVLVASSQVAQALDALGARGLPREQFAGMGQVFRKDGLVSSPVEERARYIYALSQELTSTLSQMDGVLMARVHVVLPERGDIGEAASPSTAAVFIKHQAGFSFDALQPQIRQLVTHSIPGLTEDRVSISLVSAQPRSSTRSAPALSSVLGLQVAQDSAIYVQLLLGGLGLLILILLLLVLEQRRGDGALPGWRLLTGRFQARQPPGGAE